MDSTQQTLVDTLVGHVVGFMWSKRPRLLGIRELLLVSNTLFRQQKNTHIRLERRWPGRWENRLAKGVLVTISDAWSCSTKNIRWPEWGGAGESECKREGVKSKDRSWLQYRTCAHTHTFHSNRSSQNKIKEKHWENQNQASNLKKHINYVWLSGIVCTRKFSELPKRKTENEMPHQYLEPLDYVPAIHQLWRNLSRAAILYGIG